MAPSGRSTQSEGETSELLLTTHFPNSGVTQELADPAAALLAKRSNWRLAARVVTYRTVEWAIEFVPYKYLKMDGIFPGLCCKRDQRMLPHIWSDILCLPVYWLCSRHMVTG